MAKYNEKEIEIMMNTPDTPIGMNEKQIRRLLKRKSSVNPIIKKMINKGLLKKAPVITNGKKVMYYNMTTKSRRLARKWGRRF